MTKALALGLIVTSPVIRPTSWNSSYNSRYFWLLRALWETQQLQASVIPYKIFYNSIMDCKLQ